MAIKLVAGDWSGAQVRMLRDLMRIRWSKYDVNSIWGYDPKGTCLSLGSVGYYKLEN